MVLILQSSLQAPYGLFSGRKLRHSRKEEVPIKDLLYASLGLVALTKEKVEETISDLVKKGEMSNEEGKQALDKMMSRMQEESGKLRLKMQDQIESTLTSMNVAKASDIVQIQMRLKKLEDRLDQIDQEKET